MSDRGPFSWRALERRCKFFLIDALARVMRPWVASPPPDWTTGGRRVLFLQCDRIGDMVMATGVIDAIADAQPTATVDVLASVSNAAVLSGNPHVGSVIVIDKKRPWKYLQEFARIRRTRYDVVIDPMILKPSLTAILLMWASGARHRVGIAGRGMDGAFTITVPPLAGAVHSIDRSAVLLDAFGVDPRESLGRDAAFEHSGAWRPELFLTAEELSYGEAQWRAVDAVQSERRVPRRRLLVNVSSGSKSRYWPEESFIAVLARIRWRFPDVCLLLVGLPQDEARMAAIGRGAGVPVGRTPHYRQMMALVAASDLVFTADTAVTHVASAFGKPATVMFVGTGGPCYGPYAVPSRILSTAGPDLDALPVEPVIRALEELITVTAEEGETAAATQGLPRVAGVNSRS